MIPASKVATHKGLVDAEELHTCTQHLEGITRDISPPPLERTLFALAIHRVLAEGECEYSGER